MNKRDTLLLVSASADHRHDMRTVFEADFNLLEAVNAKQFSLLLEQNHSCIASVLVDEASLKGESIDVLKQTQTNYLLTEIPVIVLLEEENSEALANAFWGEIEHRVVYKNRDYMLSDTFVSDLFKSIKESLNTLDSQLHLLYQRFHQEPAIQEEAVVERKRERSVEIFIADMVYATFDQIILEQLGFSIDFKQSCDAIVRYLIEREHADDMEDYGRMMMIIFNLLDQAEERLQLVDQITFRRKLNYPDAFTAHLGNLIETLINRNFRWHLYFAILFAMEDKPREQVMEEFVIFYKSSILENRSLIAFEEIDSQQEKEIFDVLLEEVGKQLEMTQKVEYLCADGLKQIHRGFNYILPIIRSEISNGIGWQEIRQTHIEKFVDKIKI